jgi:hypothetical protein
VGLVCLLLGLALLVVAAAVPAAAVARGRIAPFLVAVWVLAFAEVVIVSLALSYFSALTRPWLLAALVAIAVVAVAVGRQASVRPPSIRRALSVARELAADRLLLALALGALGMLAYAAALAFLTAPTEHDALTYHLIRAALWKQEHGISWIDAPVDVRANISPIVAEVGVAATMILGGGDRFVALPQLSALVVCVVGVFGLSRTIGLERRASAFGALLVAFLPVALVQSGTAMNDVVPAALAVATALFALGRARGDLVLAALALALMTGTKTASFLVLPVLALVVAVGQPVRRWLVMAAAGAAAIVVGSLWYLLTEDEGGDTTALASTLGSDRLGDPAVGLARFARHLASALEVPGVGRDQLLYVVAGVVLTLVGLFTRRRALRLAGVAVALVPLVALTRGLAEEAYKRTWWKLGRVDLVRFDDGDGDGTLVSAGYSWYGPVAVVLTVATLALVVRELRARRLPAVALPFALAPLLTIATLAYVLVWSPVFGRLVMPGVMLGAVVWGVVYPIRWAAVAATTASVLVGVMSFWWFDRKQVGITLLEPARHESVWSASRWELQDYGEAGARFVAFANATVPKDATVAVARPGTPPYQFFGPGLTRTVLPVTGGVVPRHAGWYVGYTGEWPSCARAWARVHAPESQYWLLRRVRNCDA